ncbi:MAG: hypothetical protein V4617_01680 [Gemmatimonadota bacterium]
MDIRHTRPWRRLLPLFACAVLPALHACVSQEEKDRRETATMVERAKAATAAESVFVQDSISLMASITVDTVDSVELVPRRATDASGNRWADTIYRAITPSGAKCIVDSLRFNAMRKGDTLSCQWEKGS